MANYSTLKAAVAAVVKSNGNQEVTGANMQTTLLSIINSIGGGGYIFEGVATPNTSPGTPDENVFYIGGAGTYANFGTSVEIGNGEIGVFTYNGTWQSAKLSTAGGVYDFSSSFVANGTMMNLSAIIPQGTLITSITGSSSISSVNLYDGNGENQLRLTPSMLPYLTTIDYHKASTWIDGTPTLTLNVGGYLSIISSQIEKCGEDITDIDESITDINEAIANLRDFSSTFIADGAVRVLSNVIPQGTLITSVTGSDNISSINLYDENGGNMLRLTSDMLPYFTTIDYYKASTWKDGAPTLSVNVGGYINSFTQQIENLNENIANIEDVVDNVSSVPSALTNILTMQGVLQLLERMTASYFAIKRNEYANMENFAVGGTFSLIQVASTNFTYDDIEVEEGDVVFLTTAGNTAKAKSYAIMDANNIILSISQPARTNELIVIPANAKRMVVNTSIDYPYSCLLVMGKTSVYDEIATALSPINDFSATFVANGVAKVLSKIIPQGMLITSITGSSNISSVNLYDANGGNALRLTPDMLPYLTTIEYHKASTYIDGGPVLSINVNGKMTAINDLSNVVNNNSIYAKKYDIARHDNEFNIDKLFTGNLISTLIQLQPNFEMPTQGAYISTDVDYTGVRTENTDEQWMRAFAPYFYVNGEKRGTIVLFDEDGTPYIYDKNGNKRTINIE